LRTLDYPLFLELTIIKTIVSVKLFIQFRITVATFKIPAIQKALAHMQSFRLWSEEEREISMLQTLSELEEQKNIWIFGYGSLVWRPEFTYEESRHAILEGYSRSLCLWSCVNRGTPEQPGLVFGLKQGGLCEGRVYRIPNENILGQFRMLWKREMPSASYIPMWLNCQTTEGIVKALVFVMDTETDAYIGDLSEDETIDIVLNASGTYGPCHEYVIQTSDALARSGVKDDELCCLSEKIRQRLR